MKNYTKTALGIILSLSVIASASNAGAFLGMFEDDKDTLKDSRRVPILNSTSAYNNAPDPNLAYGSLPNTAPLDYYVPNQPQGMQAPAAPRVELNTPVAPQMAMPAMPPVQAPELQMSMPVAPMTPISMPPAAPNYVGTDGYPKLSSVPQAPVQMPAGSAPVNIRAENLKEELRTSQSMANSNASSAPADMRLPSAQMSAGQAPVAMSMPPQPNLLPEISVASPAPQGFVDIPQPPQFSQAPANFTPIQQTASVAPVFPSGPSVTVHSKRAGGGVSVAESQPQQVWNPPVQASAPIEVASAVPNPIVESAPLRTAYAPPPAPTPLTNQKYVGEASMPVASSFDAPIDGYVSVPQFPMGSSYTVASTGNSSYGSHTGILPRSRYESYRRNGRR